MIESSDNRQVKRIKRLNRESKYRRQENAFVVEGWKMVKEALAHRIVQNIYLAEREKGRIEEIRSLSGNTIEPEMVSDKLFCELSDTVTPQGVLAVVSMPEYCWEELAGEASSLLCLEDIRDPGNMGTMLRTAEGAGMTGVVVSKGCVDLFNPKVVRAAMGALFRVKFVTGCNLSTKVESMKNEGFVIYAAGLGGECDYTGFDYAGKTGILIGSEASGLSSEVSAMADHVVKIPMEGKLESLNAAVAAALFMYEIHRKRR